MEDTTGEVKADIPQQIQQTRKKDGRRKNTSPESDVLKLTKQYLGKLRRNRNHMARARLRETPEQTKARLEDCRIRAAIKRQSETPEQRAARLERARLYKMELRMMETPEQRVIRLENARRRMTKARLNETPEHRAMRLERIRLYNQEVRSKEKTEQRSVRLDDSRSYMSTVRQIGTEDTMGTQDGSITIEIPSLESNSRDYNKMYDDKSFGETSNDSLNSHEGTSIPIEVDNKALSLQSQEMGKNRVTKNIMKILMSTPSFINNYYCDKAATQMKQPDIQSLTEMINPEDTPSYNVETCYDFQLNSITGNVLPLDQEVQLMLEMGNATTNPNQFPCPKCNRIYRYAHSLKKHMNVHDTIE